MNRKALERISNLKTRSDRKVVKGLTKRRNRMKAWTPKINSPTDALRDYYNHPEEDDEEDYEE